MKILLIAVTLLVVIEVKAHPGWAYPNFQDGTRNNPGRGPPWTVPQRMENPNNRFNSDVEWVCRNPRTNDIVCIFTFEILKHNVSAKNQSFTY